MKKYVNENCTFIISGQNIQSWRQNEKNYLKIHLKNQFKKGKKNQGKSYLRHANININNLQVTIEKSGNEK